MSNGPTVDSQNPSTFTPPRHWVGPEELDPAYWTDEPTQEKRGQEFYEKPLEWLEKMDKTGAVTFARREFLTVMSASMAMAGLSCARRPVHKIIPYVVKPEEIMPGVATYYASTSKDCPCGCGLLVKTREGRPIKLEGNPDHPVNRGALCAQAQASVLGLYDTDRLKSPIARARGAADSHLVTWQEADAKVSAALSKARPGAVRVLTPQLRGNSTPKLIRDFLASNKGGKQVEFEPIGLEEISQAQERCYGTAVTPYYHFDKADVVVSISADFLGNWVSPVRHSGDFTARRKLAGTDTKSARLNKLFVFEPTMTITGASADERYAIRPGDEHKIALAIAHEVVVTHRAGQYANDAQVTQALSSYAPDAVASDVGLPSAQPLKQAAEYLLKAKGAGLVVAGSIASRVGGELFTQIAVNFLNSALANEGTTVDGTSRYSAPTAGLSGLKGLVHDMQSGAVDVLIVYRSNPAYNVSPAVADFAEASKKVPLIVSISDRDDETGRISDLVLPDHHYLENWGDASPYVDLYSLQQPAIAPLHETRAFEDGLLVWSGKKESWHDYLKANWRDTLYKSAGAASNFEDFWDSCLRRGVLDVRAAKGGGGRTNARAFKAASMSGMPAFKAGAASDLVLALYPSVALQDGRHANNAWLQEMPDPITSVTWDNYLNIAPSTAQKFGMKNDDVAEFTVPGLAPMKLPIRVQPGMHPGVVSAAVGYGRTSAGRVGTDCGKNVFPFASGSAVKLRRTQELYRLAATQWFNVTKDRPIINDISLAEYRENAAAAQETVPELRLNPVPTIWPKHEYKGHRWGMAIDLNSCTGCGACTVACQAENNVPVVGREQVRNNRHMGWIRIDRYFSGADANSPEGVVFQPMLCQHCENAPCETVCPVVATVHDDEGLNVQVYNRCVGTRYCQNNCPYKVRRFNFFDHWWTGNPSGEPKVYEGSVNLVWNPDVTVRTRGIMEKCTFCTQRIREAKDKAKDMGVAVADGSFKTACQQTCPNDAIVFGDMNDPNSRVSKLRADPRNYRVLESNNTVPSVSYLTRVRNVAAKSKEASAAAARTRSVEYESARGGVPARTKEESHG